MTEPVLVIHGVANRSKAEFAARVEQLAADAGRDPASLIPVYWGDLGAKTGGIADAIPELGAAAVSAIGGTGVEDALWAAAVLTAPGDDVAGVRGVDSNARANIAAEAFMASVPAPAEVAVLSGEEQDAELKQAVAEAWMTTTYLKAVTRADLLRELGVAVAEAAGATEASGAEAVRDLTLPRLQVRKRISDAVHAIDRAVGAVLGEVGGRLNTFLRTELGPHIGEFLGDVIVYHAHRPAIQNRVREALAVHAPEHGTPDRPISVLGHSLGGVIAFDLAVGADSPLWIDHLVTFGSQSPLLHVVDPREPVVAPFVHPTPSKLPTTIKRWTNLWEPRDPLAFIAAKVFVLASEQPPTDRAVASLASSGLWTHSSYWALPELAEVVHDAVP